MTPAANGSNIFVAAGIAPNTTQVGVFGAVDQFDTISQTFATTPGAHYNLTFFYQVESGPYVNNHFVVLFNGVNTYDNLNANPGYGTFTFNSLLATGSSTTLEFEGFNAPSFDYLDNVSVTPAGVPDSGSTVSLLSFALLGVAVLQRKLNR